MTTPKPEPTEEFYNKNAKSDCRVCSGQGMLRYHFGQDTTRYAPCPRCFPNDQRAVEMEKRFYAL